MLELKDTVDKHNPVVIFVSKAKGRRLSFHPGTTDPKDYPNLMLLGFNSFRCSVCKSDQCYGDCTPEVKIKQTDKTVIKPIDETNLNLDLDLGGDNDNQVDRTKLGLETFSDIEIKEPILDTEVTIEEEKIICATCKEPIEDKRKKKYCSDKCKRDKNKTK